MARESLFADREWFVGCLVQLVELLGHYRSASDPNGHVLTGREGDGQFWLYTLEGDGKPALPGLEDEEWGRFVRLFRLFGWEGGGVRQAKVTLGRDGGEFKLLPWDDESAEALMLEAVTA